MHPRIELRYVFAFVWFAAAAIACGPPKPDAVDVRSIDGTQATPVRRPIAERQRLAEGDLVVVDTDPVDGDESMDLCVDATSTSPAIARVARVEGKCRQFVVLATSPGAASVRFEARGTINEIAIEVSAAP